MMGFPVSKAKRGDLFLAALAVLIFASIAFVSAVFVWVGLLFEMAMSRTTRRGTTPRNFICLQARASRAQKLSFRVPCQALNHARVQRGLFLSSRKMSHSEYL